MMLRLNPCPFQLSCGFKSPSQSSFWPSEKAATDEALICNAPNFETKIYLVQSPHTVFFVLNEVPPACMYVHKCQQPKIVSNFPQRPTVLSYVPVLSQLFHLAMSNRDLFRSRTW